MRSRLGRILLAAYPRSFREERGEELLAFWNAQRREPRYRGWGGSIRFAIGVGVDAVIAGLRLRWRQRVKGGDVMGSLGSDVSYAWRSLRAAPLFSGMAVATLALGIAATSAVFAVVEGIVLRPLSYPQAEQLVVVLRTDQEDATPSVAWPDLRDWRDSNAWFDGLIGHAEASESFEWEGGAETLWGAFVTADFFDVLGIPLQLGRSFTSEEDRIEGPDAIVLSHSLWMNRFNGDPRVLGRTVPFSSGPVPIVGVAAEGFMAPDGRADYWLPLQEDELLARVGLPTGSRTLSFLSVLGRLADGVDAARAQAGLRSMAREIDESVGKSPEQMSNVTLHGLAEWTVTDVRRSLFFLLAAATLVLIVATANVAGLAISRASARRRELAVRSALGAPRPRLVRQLLVEGALLAACAGALGVALASLGLTTLVELAPPGLPRADSIGMHSETLTFAALATILSGAMFGLVPGLRASRVAPADALAGGRGAHGGPRTLRPQQLLVSFQVAVSVILLSGAALLTTSFVRLLRVDRGFDSTNVVTATVSPSEARYATPEELGILYDELLEEVRALPGVSHASTTYSPPLFGNGFRTSIVPEGRTEDPADRFWATTVIVGSDYFGASGIALLRGRDFDSDDVLGAAPVVIVNEELARRLWPGEDPLGKSFIFSGGLRGSADSFDRAFFPTTPMTVVGVAADIRRDRLDTPPAPEYYRPHAQIRWAFQYLVVRTATDPEAVAGALREAIWRVDPTIPVREVRTVADRVAESVAAERFRALLLVAFALTTCLLAMVGLYATTALAASRRVREMGIRLALGARRTEIVREVLGKALGLAAVGVVFGVGLSIAGTRALSSVLSAMLFEIEPTDVRVYAGVALLTTTVALLACWAPARRAGRVDPVASLREE